MLASIKKDILYKIKAEMPNIILDFLPPYSPDYNLIELVWHSAKEYIAHRLFESVEQLEELLNILLNEGGLIIKWGRQIKQDLRRLTPAALATTAIWGWAQPTPSPGIDNRHFALELALNHAFLSS